MKFSPDHRFLFCWHFPPRSHNHHLSFRFSVNVENRDNFSLDVSPEHFSYKPWEFESCSESGFTLGRDPFHCFVQKVASGSRVTETSFAFLVNNLHVLRSNYKGDSTEMLSLDELTKDSDGRKTPVDNLVFSVNGETVYFVDVKAKISRITAWDVLSGEFKAENIIGGSCVVPVKEGVLLTTSSGTLELWNFQLTECVRCWTDIRNITGMFLVSDERVVCSGQEVGKLIILDTTSGDKVTLTISDRYCYFACSSKCHLITYLRCRCLALTSFRPLAEISWCIILFRDVFSCGTVYLNLFVHDCKSVVSDEECVIHTYDKPSGCRL